MRINTGSDLIEIEFTETEAQQAKGFHSRDLTLMYLQNTRIAILRQLAQQEFTRPTDDEENQRARAYLKGQYDILGAILEEAHANSAPAVSGDSQPQLFPQ